VSLDSLKWQIAIIGAGNVAWHISKQLCNRGVHIAQVISRSKDSAAALAKVLDTGFSDDLSSLAPGNDACIICISDDAIEEVARKACFGNSLVLHTAGSISMNVFEGHAKHYGVLYPFQTFTRDRVIDLHEIPLLIEANTPENLEKIKQLASLISGRIIEAGSEVRIFLHLAGVFANNFSNHMYVLAEEILQEKRLDTSLIKPLITETAAKALSMSASSAQTGPAVRGNLKVMEKHLSLLAGRPDLQKIYQLLSESIQKRSLRK
jgi:predicted short-subunit dehydrogenase-like oxidoreductase (DUF2520 family)